MPGESRDKHLYVVGATGAGKSMFLEGLLRQDILNQRRTGARSFFWIRTDRFTTASCTGWLGRASTGESCRSTFVSMNGLSPTTPSASGRIHLLPLS